MRPTIVLVHGAFAESASRDRVIDPLVAVGHRVIAAANPLRSLAGGAAAVSDRIIPAALRRHMAERARAQRTVAIEGASHAMRVSRPDATVHPILEAAAQRVAA